MIKCRLWVSIDDMAASTPSEKTEIKTIKNSIANLDGTREKSLLSQRAAIEKTVGIRLYYSCSLCVLSSRKIGSIVRQPAA
jgi:hypothetical protein